MKIIPDNAAVQLTFVSLGDTHLAPITGPMDVETEIGDVHIEEGDEKAVVMELDENQNPKSLKVISTEEMDKINEEYENG